MNLTKGGLPVAGAKPCKCGGPAVLGSTPHACPRLGAVTHWRVTCAKCGEGPQAFWSMEAGDAAEHAAAMRRAVDEWKRVNG